MNYFIIIVLTEYHKVHFMIFVKYSEVMRLKTKFHFEFDSDTD